MNWFTSFAVSPTQRDGAAAEARAEAYLKEAGLTCVGRNFRSKGGEIDLIMQDGATLVFVEVRKRRGAQFGGAAASVTPAKQAKLIHAAQRYLQQCRSEPPCRFDVVALDGEKITWLRDAFSA